MAYRIRYEAYSDNFALPQGVIGDDFRSLDGICLKVILLIYRNSNKNYSVNLLSSLLGVDDAQVQRALDYWIEKGLLVETEQPQIQPEAVVLPVKSAPSHKGNSELLFLMECMEKQLGRPITSVEQRSVLHIMEHYNLPADVILMAVEYCDTVGKPNVRYIEKVCASWAEKGIVTHELAEQYLVLFQQSLQNEAVIRKMFGIENRNLIESEREAVLRWMTTYQFTPEIIKLAYDKTMSAIHRLSFPYINKILTSWYELGYRSADEIMQKEGLKPGKGRTSYDIDEIDRFWDQVPKLF